MRSLFQFILIVIAFTSCSKPSEEQTSVSVNFNSALIADDFLNGSVMFGRKIGTDQFFINKSLQQNQEVVLDNGKWIFGFIGWSQDLPGNHDQFEGKVYCSVIEENLVGNEIELAFDASSDDCRHSIFNQSSFHDPAGPPSMGFKKFSVATCEITATDPQAFLNSQLPSATITDFRDCNTHSTAINTSIDGNSVTIAKLPGLFYFKLSLITNSPLGIPQEEVSTRCMTAKGIAINTTTPPAIPSELRLPLGSESIPFKYRVDKFLNSGCNGAPESSTILDYSANQNNTSKTKSSIDDVEVNFTLINAL